MDKFQFQLIEAGAIGLSRAAEADQPAQTGILKPLHHQPRHIGADTAQVFDDLVHLVQHYILDIRALQEYLDAVDIETAFADARAGLRERRVGHDQNGRMLPGALLKALQFIGRAGKDHLGRKTQPKGQIAQFANPLLLIIARGHQHQHRLPGIERAQPILDAHLPDHRFAAAGGRFHDQTAVATAAEHGVGLVLVRARNRRTQQIGMAPRTGLVAPGVLQRGNHLVEDAHALFAQSGCRRKDLIKGRTPRIHIGQRAEALGGKLIVEIRAQAAPSNSWRSNPLRCRCGSRAHTDPLCASNGRCRPNPC